MSEDFGNRNYITMYDDLFEQLEPHFEKMKLNAELLKNKFNKNILKIKMTFSDEISKICIHS